MTVPIKPDKAKKLTKLLKENFEKIGSPITRLIEECSELIHILCKVDRFGWDNYHPDDKNKTPNSVMVWEEMDDVEKIIHEVKSIIYKGDMAMIRRNHEPHNN